MKTVTDSALVALGYLPPWLVALAVFVLIVAGAGLIQNIIIKELGKESRAWHPLLRAIFVRTRLAARLAFVIVAVGIALPLAQLSHVWQDAVQRVTTSAVIVLIGWAVLVAVDMGVDRYLGGFRLDTADNLLARKAVTQMRVMKRALEILVLMLTAGFALMTFDSVRQYGISLFASAGVAGVIAGLAARPLFTNLLAGVQLALTQPVRIDDAVVIEGEWGWIEEITSTYVVVRLWDLRRLIVPLRYFFENPFQNWTRTTADLIGSVYLYVDYTTPVDRVRAMLMEIVKASALWDGKAASLQVTDAKDTTIELRALVSARNSSNAWDLRCEVREKLIAWLQKEYPGALPRRRNEVATFVQEEPADGNGLADLPAAERAAS